jgi:hypothetical protein
MEHSMDPFEQTNTSVPVQRKSSFGDVAVWMRGLYMLLLVLAFGIAQTLLCVTAIAQFLWLLFSGEPNAQLTRFGSSLARWVSDAARFLTFSSEVKPFPWAPWPPAD